MWSIGSLYWSLHVSGSLQLRRAASRLAVTSGDYHTLCVTEKDSEDYQKHKVTARDWQSSMETARDMQ